MYFYTRIIFQSIFLVSRSFPQSESPKGRVESSGRDTYKVWGEVEPEELLGGLQQAGH